MVFEQVFAATSFQRKRLFLRSLGTTAIKRVHGSGCFSLLAGGATVRHQVKAQRYPSLNKALLLYALIHGSLQALQSSLMVCMLWNMTYLRRPFLKPRTACKHNVCEGSIFMVVLCLGLFGCIAVDQVQPVQAVLKAAGRLQDTNLNASSIAPTLAARLKISTSLVGDDGPRMDVLCIFTIITLGM